MDVLEPTPFSWVSFNEGSEQGTAERFQDIWFHSISQADTFAQHEILTFTFCIASGSFPALCAEGRSRTDTEGLAPLDFESSASTSSATSACGVYS